MNEEFGILKDMIPACEGHEMHKLAILQASIDYMRYLKKVNCCSVVFVVVCRSIADGSSHSASQSCKHLGARDEILLTQLQFYSDLHLPTSQRTKTMQEIRKTTPQTQKIWI